MMSIHVSQNTRHRIKSSQWTTHRTWHVVIRQAMLANEKQHHLMPASMSYGMCTSARRHRRRAMAGPISKGLCALGKQRCPTKSGIV